MGGMVKKMKKKIKKEKWIKGTVQYFTTYKPFNEIQIHHLFYLLAICISLVIIQLSCCFNKKVIDTEPYYNSSCYAKPYKVLGKWYIPYKKVKKYSRIGIASWYGKKFHGRKTSNGEIYNMHKISAAHKTLPLGSYVNVCNLENNKNIIVRINDRGPFVDNRIIDLSYAAAKRIGMANQGTAKVKVDLIPASLIRKKEKSSFECFTVQVGAFKSKKNANELMSKLHKAYGNVHYQKIIGNNGSPIYRVYIGRCLQPKEAAGFEEKLAQNGFDALVMPISNL